MSGLKSYRNWLQGDGPKVVLRRLTLSLAILVAALWAWAFISASTESGYPGYGVTQVVYAAFGTFLLTVLYGIIRLFIAPTNGKHNG